MEEIRFEELEMQKADLLPDREEMRWGFRNYNVALSSAQQGSVAQANQGLFVNYYGG
jgi:hypothetical protein